MSEKSILMSQANIPLLLAVPPRKLRTMRPINQLREDFKYVDKNIDYPEYFQFRNDLRHGHGTSQNIKPRYQVGDRLWVRETHVIENTIGYEAYVNTPIPTDRPVKKIETDEDGIYHLIPHYRATEPEPNIVAEGAEDDITRWTPSTFMPKWASRIFIPKVTKVSVQRPQDLTWYECRDEGITLVGDELVFNNRQQKQSLFRIKWKRLYISIYGEEKWKQNLWHFVTWWKNVEIRR